MKIKQPPAFFLSLSLPLFPLFLSLSHILTHCVNVLQGPPGKDGVPGLPGAVGAKVLY